MKRKTDRFAPYRVINTTIGGLTYRGQFRIVDKMITVQFQGRQTTRPLGDGIPEALAKTMLSELVKGTGSR